MQRLENGSNLAHFHFFSFCFYFWSKYWNLTLIIKDFHGKMVLPADIYDNRLTRYILVFGLQGSRYSANMRISDAARLRLLSVGMMS